MLHDLLTVQFLGGFTSGIHCVTLFLVALLLRYAGLSSRLIIACLLILGLPLINEMLVPLALLVGLFIQHVVCKVFASHRLNYNFFGLSKQSLDRLRNIVYASSKVTPKN